MERVGGLSKIWSRFAVCLFDTRSWTPGSPTTRPARSQPSGMSWIAPGPNAHSALPACQTVGEPARIPISAPHTETALANDGWRDGPKVVGSGLADGRCRVQGRGAGAASRSQVEPNLPPVARPGAEWNAALRLQSPTPLGPKLEGDLLCGKFWVVVLVVVYCVVYEVVNVPGS